MNRALLEAAAATIDPDVHAQLDPAPDRCCVVFTRDPHPG